MTYDYESQYSKEESGGFFAGMLTGLAVGVGIGMLFAPRSGSELRQTIAQSAGDFQRKANESYQQASEKVKDVVDKGRDAVSRGKESWQQGRNDIGTTSTSSSPAGTTL